MSATIVFPSIQDTVLIKPAVILSSPQATIDFPITDYSYTDLLFIIAARSAVAATSDLVSMKLNSDTTAANYIGFYDQYLGGAVTPTNLNGSVGRADLGYCVGASGSADYRNIMELRIKDYYLSNTKKLWRCSDMFMISAVTGSRGYVLAGGSYEPTAQLNDVLFFFNGGNNFTAKTIITGYYTGKR